MHGGRARRLAAHDVRGRHRLRRSLRQRHHDRRSRPRRRARDRRAGRFESPARHAPRRHGTRRVPGLKEFAARAQSLVPSPAVGNLAGDANLEIVIAGSDGRIYVIDAKAARSCRAASSTAVRRPSRRRSSVTSTAMPTSRSCSATKKGDLGAWNLDGTPVPGFPIALRAEVRGTPTLADVNGDGRTDLALLAWDGRVSRVGTRRAVECRPAIRGRPIAATCIAPERSVTKFQPPVEIQAASAAWRRNRRRRRRFVARHRRLRGTSRASGCIAPDPSTTIPWAAANSVLILIRSSEKCVGAAISSSSTCGWTPVRGTSTAWGSCSRSLRRWCHRAARRLVECRDRGPRELCASCRTFPIHAIRARRYDSRFRLAPGDSEVARDGARRARSPGTRSLAYQTTPGRCACRGMGWPRRSRATGRARRLRRAGRERRTVRDHAS